ncbi:MAG: hypothetical protein ABL958_10625 [Bdellovibrionia bacterium]
MSRIFAVVLTLAVSTQSWGALPMTWKQIINNAKYKKTPSKEQVQAQAVRAEGNIQTFVLADRYVFLFDKTGVPIVGFDLTLEPTGVKEMVMGAIGIGAWSFKGFLSKYKQIKENPETILRQGQLAPGMMPLGTGSEAQVDDELYSEMDATGAKYVPDWSDKDIAKGYKEFAKLKFNSEWVKEHGGLQALTTNQKDGFKPASFALADLYLEQKQSNALHKTMNEFAKVIYQKELAPAELGAFMKQFKMNWSEEKKEFVMEWSPKAYTRGVLSTPEIPGWILNYQNPLDILAYKYSLENIQKYAAGLESIIPATYAHIVGIMISRVVNGLKARLDGHENQMLALFEGALRGDYRIDISLLEPEKFIKTSILMLYLNKMIDTDDVTDAVAKMQMVHAAEAKYRAENLKYLTNKEIKYKMWSDGRFATIYDKNNQRKGIMALAMKGGFLTKVPGMHYYDNAPWLKTFSRVGLEVFTDAVRVYMPTQLDFSKWLASWFNIGISIYIPGEAWDMIFRTRAFGEMAYEGQAIAQMNEVLNGRWKEIPGYDRVELGEMLNHMTGARANTFEIPRKHEMVAIPKHLEMVKKMINGGTIAPAYLKQ